MENERLKYMEMKDMKELASLLIEFKIHTRAGYQEATTEKAKKTRLNIIKHINQLLLDIGTSDILDN